METPTTYAARLSRYIPSPTKIERLVEVEFGAGRAPALHEIAEMRYRVEQEAKKLKNASVPKPVEIPHLHLDALDFRPRALVKDAAPAGTIQAKPIATPPPPRPIVEERSYAGCGKRYRPSTVELNEDYTPPERVWGASSIIAAVSGVFGILPGELLGRARATQLVCARNVAARIFIERGNSFAQTGRFLDRDHTTIMHHIQTWEPRAKRFPDMVRAYDRLAHLTRKAPA